MTPAQSFERTIRSLLRSRSEINGALGATAAARQARGEAVQGLYLIAVRAFESFLEDQIMDLACGRVAWRSRVVGTRRERHSNRLNENRRAMVEEIVLGGKRYFDYLPYDKTEEVASLLFTGGRPFKLLDPTLKTALVRCQSVRNYIAHDSEFARKKFIKSYGALKPLRAKSPKPIQYLDDDIRRGVTMFENDLTQLVATARFLS